MSEEKLYVVKNDEGKYWDFDNSGFWRPDISDCLATPSKKQAEQVSDEVSDEHGVHVVTFIEEPKKVVLTKEQAEIVDYAHGFYLPARYISINSGEDEEELLMNAYVNGYTVAKEKKYLVYLDGLVTTDGAKQYLTKKDGKWFACRIMLGLHQEFTEDELKTAPEFAQHLDRVEVTDDDE